MAKKLLIIPGHGAGDSGAVGGGKTEAALVRQLAARMKAWGGSRVKRTSYNRNYYADNGIMNLDERTYDPKKWRIVELHMDGANGSAMGGHVIQYRKRTSAGKKTAKSVSKLLPGRAETHVLRDDLANPKRADLKGYEYMLIECGFVDNKHDREWVVANMDKLAKAILKANGIVPRLKPLNVKCPW